RRPAAGLGEPSAPGPGPLPPAAQPPAAQLRLRSYLLVPLLGTLVLFCRLKEGFLTDLSDFVASVRPTVPIAERMNGRHAATVASPVLCIPPLPARPGLRRPNAGRAASTAGNAPVRGIR